MSVKFIIGRSGSGKSRYCIDSACNELINGKSNRLIFLAPEQATFQIEQSILNDGRIQGYNRLEVTSFIRMAKKAAQNMPVNTLKPLSKTGRRLLLYRLLTEIKNELKIFCGEITSGFCDQISQILSELHRYGKSPTDLLSRSQEIIESGNPEDLALAEKLHDLAIIQNNWQESVQDRYLDPDRYLDYLADYFQDNALSSDTIVWIDGFAGFTPQQLKILKLLMQQVATCYISLNLDHTTNSLKALTDPNHTLDQTNMFHPTMETCQRLTNICLENAIIIEPPIILPQGDSMPRFQKSKTLANIEKYIFSDTKPPQIADDRESSLEIVQAPNQQEEINAVARKILSLCREKNYRLRDIAIILRKLEGNEELITATLQEHNIPFFMDARRDVRHHPLIELVRSIFEMLTDNFRIDAIYDYLKTDLCPINRHQADALENYCITTGIFGSQWLSQEPWTTVTKEFNSHNKTSQFQFSINEIDQFRNIAIEPVAKMKNAIAAKSKAPGVKVITRELVKLLYELEVPQKLQQWQERTQTKGQIQQQEVHSQVYGDFIDILEELTNALEGFEISLKEYKDILFSALKEMSLRLVPPSLDQVLVGTIERSRQPDIKAAFIIGMNDGVFPAYNESSSILTDQQREFLSDNSFELAPTASLKLLQEKYLAYIAFTRASEYLWVSFCSIDNNDKALNESPFINDLKKAAGITNVNRLHDSRNSADLNRVTNNRQLARELTAALADARDNGYIEPIWQRLYQQSQELEIPDIALTGLTDNNNAELDSAIAQKLTGTGRIDTSISRLEEYSRCPFKYYCKYMLKLNKREPFALQAVDLGVYYHAILCELFKKLKRNNQNWHDITDEHIPKLVEEAADIVSHNNLEIKYLIEKSFRNSFIFAQARKDLKNIAASICKAARGGNFRQVEAELSFGGIKGDIPGLLLKLSETLSLELNGKIDRVDTLEKYSPKAVAVYDYKLSGKKFDWVKFYYGLELQLACYLLVASENYYPTQAVPAGMFYLETRPKVEKDDSLVVPDHILDNNNDQTNLEQLANTKALGIMNEDYIKDFDCSINGSSSFFHGVRSKKDGSFSGANLSTSDTLQSVLYYSKKILSEIAKEISYGKIDAMPFRLKYETPCQRCEFQSVCRFDKTINNYRELKITDKNEIIRNISENKENS